MGRKRRSNKHLPQRVYLKNGTFWFRPKVGKAVNLGRDLGPALAEYGRLIGGTWSGRTIGDVIDRYRIDVLPLKRSAKTRADEGIALARLKRVFGHLRPDQVEAPQLYRYLDARKTPAGKPAPVAGRHEVALLGHVFAKAIRWGLTSRNPVRGLDLGPRAPKRRAVTLAEVAAVRALANPRMQVAIDLAVLTGQRRGDLLTLRRDQVTDEGILFRQGKTGAVVPMVWSDDLRAAIARARALPPQVPGDYLIRKPNGKPYSAAGFSAIWQRLMAKHVKAGGSRFSFHDLRSVSADGAATIEEAQTRLGHASPETTRRFYLRAPRKAKPRS